ncbi:universal stress protein [Marilutibacter alkalisoli]|nr:universal stress protein [Lysobacter alkalisoli]
MIKDLVLPLTDTPGDANALDAALILADYTQAHLTVVGTIYLPSPAYGAWGMTLDASSMQRVHTEARAMAEAQAAQLRERLNREAVSSELRLVETLVPNSQRKALLHARYADLVVMTSAEDGTGGSPSVHAFFSTMLLESGRPVLVVPPSCRLKMPPRHIVVAWRPTREATNALHAAMPLLRTAQTVDVLEIESGPEERSEDGEQPGADIATHLARHDLKVRVVVKQQHGDPVATALLRHCNESDAELLVAGGYGGSRFREWMLGGTTRQLLQFAHLPVFFSH